MDIKGNAMLFKINESRSSRTRKPKSPLPAMLFLLILFLATGLAACGSGGGGANGVPAVGGDGGTGGGDGGTGGGDGGTGGGDGGTGGGGGGTGGGGTPSALFTLTAPATQPAYTNTGSLIIGGSCQDGVTFTLSGDTSQSGSCTAGAFAFTVNKSADGSHQFFLSAADGTGASDAATISWVLDTVPPAPVMLLSPPVSPAITGDDQLTFMGTCETGATVHLSGADTQSAPCDSEHFSLTVAQTTDGVYDYAITQADRAGNVSGSVSEQWVRDTTLPVTPTLVTPGVNPYYAGAGPLTLSGGCTDTHTVDVTGTETLTTTCGSTVADTYSFTLATPTADGSHTYQITQTSASGTSSGAVVFDLIWDTTAPAAPVLTVPAVSPYNAPGALTLKGHCENNATVNLSGDATQSTPCADGDFSFTMDPGTDGQYSYTLAQTDRAGNVSATVAQVWNRSAAAVPAPVIFTPGTSPYVSNGSTLSLTGQCQNGYTVTLEDVFAATTTPVICVNGYFAFDITESVDGDYTFNVTQDNGGTPSAAATQVWTRDTAPPSLTLDSQPPTPNPWNDSRFTFSSTDATAVFECNLDGAGYTSCTSPKAYSGLTGSHTLDIRAIDPAGNHSTLVSHAWTQQAHDTVVLYHLDDTAPWDDSSLYAGVNNLTATGTTSVSGQFAQGRGFATGDILETADDATHQAFRSVMTVEAFVSFTTLPTGNGVRAVFASKNGGAGNFGWEFGLKQHGGNSNNKALYFIGSLDGTNFADVKSSFLTNPLLATGTVYHVAVVWNKGTVSFFLDGVPVGIRSIGTAGSSVLFDATAPLRLGGNQADGINVTDDLDGMLDEVRISQTARYTTPFSLPATAFTAD